MSSVEDRIAGLQDRAAAKKRAAWSRVQRASPGTAQFLVDLKRDFNTEYMYSRLSIADETIWRIERGMKWHTN